MLGNSVTLIGNLVKDPELKTGLGANADVTLCKFSIARSYTVNEKARAEFFDCTLFGEHAVRVAESLRKGLRVVVVGKLQQQKWTSIDPQTKAETSHSKVELLVDEVCPSLKWATCVVTKAAPVALDSVPEAMLLASVGAEAVEEAF